MSTAHATTLRMTPAEYLAQEETADFKSEYYQGELFAMSGATRAHSMISVRLTIEVAAAIGDRKCEVYSSDTKIKVRSSGLYAYPDLSVACDAPRFEDPKGFVLLNPQVIFEVLSASTADYDREVKFDHYASLESLKAYVLVSQWEPLVEVFWRNSITDSWGYERGRGLDAVVRIPSMNLSLRLAEIYKGVELVPRTIKIHTLDVPEENVVVPS